MECTIVICDNERNKSSKYCIEHRWLKMPRCSYCGILYEESSRLKLCNKCYRAGIEGAA